jgi:DNA-binding transcriptional LysR family regulator
MLDPRRLLTFRAVAHARSFSRAAAQLSLTQPAVSQHVGSLERQLGTRLIERGAGAFELTAAGALLLAHADAFAERLERADRQLEELIAAERRELRIGAYPSALATLVPDALVRLRALEPGVAVQARQDSTEGLASAVRDGGLHVALCFQDAADARREHAGLVRREVFEEDFLALLPAAHPLAARPSLRLAELRDETWSAPSREGIVARTCRAAGFEPEIAFVTTDPLAIGALVAAGLCVTVTFERLAARLGAGVVAVPLQGRPARRAVYALAPPEGEHPLVPVLLGAIGELVGA